MVGLSWMSLCLKRKQSLLDLEGLRLMAANACIVVARASMISILLLILLQMASFSLCFSWS